MPISDQPIIETTVKHVTSDDMIEPDIVVKIKSFDQSLTESLDNTNVIIDSFYGFGVEDEGSDIPQWDTWDTAYRDDQNTQTETKYGNIME